MLLRPSFLTSPGASRIWKWVTLELLNQGVGNILFIYLFIHWLICYLVPSIMLADITQWIQRYRMEGSWELSYKNTLWSKKHLKTTEPWGGMRVSQMTLTFNRTPLLPQLRLPLPFPQPGMTCWLPAVRFYLIPCPHMIFFPLLEILHFHLYSQCLFLPDNKLHLVSGSKKKKKSSLFSPPLVLKNFRSSGKSKSSHSCSNLMIFK